MASGEQFTGWYSRVEGPDGAGKTSLLNMARDYADTEGIDTEFIREPGTGEFGEAIRDFLLHKGEYDFSPQTEYALFTANRSHIISEILLRRLRAGLTTISDRGIESSVSMQGGEAGAITARNKGSDGSLTREQILEVARILLPDFYNRPNGLVLLSLSKEVRRQRMQSKAASTGLDKIEMRTLEFSDAVHDGYIYQEALPHATVIDAEQHPDDVFARARPILFGPEHA